MTVLSTIAMSLLLAQAGVPCVTLDAQSYCLAYHTADDVTETWEYVRSGETVDNWQRLITIQRYKLRGSFDYFIGSQDQQLKRIGVTAQWVAAPDPVYAREAGTAVTLESASHTEYTLFYFFEDVGSPIQGVIFARRKALPGGEPPSQKQIVKWIDQMRLMSPP